MKINFPNTLIIVRILFVPIIIIFLLLPGLAPDIFDKIMISDDKNIGLYWTDIVAGVLFLIASLTDYIDGWYARKYNQITTFGKLFDPLADKILVNTTLIIFASRGMVPIIFVLLFITRDILVDGLRMMLASNSIVLSADKLGKLKTIFQMIGLSLLFFIHPISNDAEGFFQMFNWTWENEALNILLEIGLVFSVVSGFNYFIRGFKSLNEKNG